MVEKLIGRSDTMTPDQDHADWVAAVWEARRWEAACAALTGILANSGRVFVSWPTEAVDDAMLVADMFLKAFTAAPAEPRP